MLIGMISVFFILGLVVMLGHILIRVVNKYSPELSQDKGQLDKRKLAIINATVKEITRGKGTVQSVKKL